MESDKLTSLLIVYMYTYTFISLVSRRRLEHRRHAVKLNSLICSDLHGSLFCLEHYGRADSAELRFYFHLPQPVHDVLYFLIRQLVNVYFHVVTLRVNAQAKAASLTL